MNLTEIFNNPVYYFFISLYFCINSFLLGESIEDIKREKRLYIILSCFLLLHFGIIFWLFLYVIIPIWDTFLRTTQIQMWWTILLGKHKKFTKEQVSNLKRYRTASIQQLKLLKNDTKWFKKPSFITAFIAWNVGLFQSGIIFKYFQFYSEDETVLGSIIIKDEDNYFFRTTDDFTLPLLLSKNEITKLKGENSDEEFQQIQFQGKVTFYLEHQPVIKNVSTTDY
jgi:hypothetical protein